MVCMNLSPLPFTPEFGVRFPVSAVWKKQKMFLPHPRVKVSMGSLRDREVACSASDHQSSDFESCVWRTVLSQSFHHHQEVLLAQFSLYVHKGGLKPDSFHSQTLDSKLAPWRSETCHAISTNPQVHIWQTRWPLHQAPHTLNTTPEAPPIEHYTRRPTQWPPHQGLTKPLTTTPGAPPTDHYIRGFSNWPLHQESHRLTTTPGAPPIGACFCCSKIWAVLILPVSYSTPIKKNVFVMVWCCS